MDKEADLQKNYHQTCLQEEEYWTQKSHCLWLKAGDQNSSFFQKQAQARKCFNSIAEIKEGTLSHKDNMSIKRAASAHFKNIYSEDGETDPNSKFLGVVPLKITNSIN